MSAPGSKQGSSASIASSTAVRNMPPCQASRFKLESGRLVSLTTGLLEQGPMPCLQANKLTNIGYCATICDKNKTIDRLVSTPDLPSAPPSNTVAWGASMCGSRHGNLTIGASHTFSIHVIACLDGFLTRHAPDNAWSHRHDSGHVVAHMFPGFSRIPAQTDGCRLDGSGDESVLQQDQE